MYGGYDGEDFEGAESILITIPLNNHVTNNTLALAWEKEFLNFMKVCRTCKCFILRVLTFRGRDDMICC